MTNSSSTTSPERAPGRMARRSAGPQPYDFRRPIKLSREHVRMLQIAFETYARSCGTLLTTRLRAVSQLSLVSIEQVTYDEYLGQVGNPTLMSVVSLDPLPGSMLMEMPLTTALGSIDHMLGGPGGEQAERQLTDVELPLMKDLLKKMLDELRYSFEQVVEINPKVTTIEYNPQFLRTLSPGDAVVVATLEVKIGEIETLSTICLPFTTILPVLQADNAEGELTAAEQAARDLSRRNLTFGMASAPIEVAVRFTPITMRANDIVNLSVGDVVPLSHPASVPLAVTVNDTTFAHAVPGNQGSRLACLVVPPPKESLA